MGGPVRKDRTFFFYNFEGWKFRRQYTVIGTTATDAERRGDFSSLGDSRGTPIPVYDPQSARANPAGGGLIRDVFPGNIVPANRLDKVAGNILNFYPRPNRAPSDPFTHSNNYQANLGTAKNTQQMTAKGDHQFSPKNQTSFRYTLWEHKDDNGATGAGYFTDQLARVRNDDYKNQNFSLSDTHFFSPRLINEVRLGYVRNLFPFIPASVGTDPTTKLGLPNSVPSRTLPAVNVSGLPSLQGFPSGFGTIIGLISMDVKQIAESLTMIRGSHTVKIGTELRNTQYRINACFQCSGVFNFNNRLTGNPQGLAGTGSGLASFLLGSVADANIDSNVGTTNEGYSQAYFVQDDWKITRRLRLNFGLRYDYQQVPGERHNGLSNFNPNAINPLTGLQGRLEFAGVDFGRTVINPDYNDFAPRAGFAWDVLGKGRTVLRGGYGIYSPLTFNYSNNFGALGYKGNSTVYTAPGGNLDVPAFRLQDGFPFPVQLPVGAKLGPSGFLSQNVTIDEIGNRTPYSQQATLTLQQQLPGQFLLEAGYSGNKGTKLLGGGYDYNQLDPKYLPLGRDLLVNVPNPYAGKVPGAFGGATITRQQSLRPFPYYNRITVNNPHDASSSYHSLLLNVEKRMSSGFVMLGSYTFGKLISDGINGFGFAGSELVNALDNQNGKFDRRRERAIEATDSAGRFVLSTIYELPFGKGKRFSSTNPVISRVIGGWQANGVLTLQSGTPLRVRGANNFGIADRPNSTGISAA